MSTEPTPDFDGCNRKCRVADAHALVWGECEHAPEPEPTVSLSRVYTAADGFPAIGFDTYTEQQLADLIEPDIGSAELAWVAAHAIVHRHEPSASPAVSVTTPPTAQTAEAEPPLSPDYEHPDCGFHWHGKDGMDIPMRDGQPVCPRCELAAAADVLDRFRRGVSRLAAHAVGFQDVLDDSDRGPWGKTVGADIAELRRLAAEAPEPATQAEALAEPPSTCWQLEMLDGMWAAYGPIYADRADAVAQHRSDSKKRPTWNDVARTPVQRRIVRRTTTYTVEQVVGAEEAETQDAPPVEPHPTEADLRHALAVAARFHSQDAAPSAVGQTDEEA